MKTEFELIDEMESECGEIVIEPKTEYSDAHIRVTINEQHLYIRAEQLERFAVNILKSLKSNKLK